MDGILADGPVDVQLLDKVVNCLYSGANSQEQAQADQVLQQWRAHPDTWTKVDGVLEQSNSDQTKWLALQVLEDVIGKRWKVLPAEQRNGIRGYIVGKVIQLASNEQTLRQHQLFVGQLNHTLIQLVKQEWPHNWPGFVPDLVDSSRSSESLCENNMRILLLLSEEVFDFSSGKLTQAKVAELKQTFNNDFQMVYQLCEGVLQGAEKPSLLSACLETLLRFLNWIPLGFIFKTPMLETLVGKFLPVAPFQNVTVKCLTEVAGLTNLPEYTAHFKGMFVAFMQQLTGFLPPGLGLAELHGSGGEDAKAFLHHLAVFLATFFRHHISSVEEEDSKEALLLGMQYLVSLSRVDDQEIFKICLDYWHFMAKDLFHSEPATATGTPLMINQDLSSKMRVTSRRQLYAQVMSSVRVVMVDNMAKPEEILIEVDVDGSIVRRKMQDTEANTLYKIMRETLVFLTHLDSVDTSTFMLQKMQRLVQYEQEWTWDRLNCLCWAIGSISGAMSEEDEKLFLVHVIKCLLSMVEHKKGKDNKAVVASNVMYIVGQYPRFLRSHWRFLRTVNYKMFEFMHERHPGVQDMAVETFLKIAQKTRRKYVVTQAIESRPFVEDILEKLPGIIGDLEAAQVHVFYEAMGHIIKGAMDTSFRNRLTEQLMALPNASWGEIMGQAASNVQILSDSATATKITNILKTNVAVASSLHQYYVTQLGHIYLDTLNVYKAYSELVSQAVTQHGEQVTAHASVRVMLAVKKQTLRLLSTFIEHAQDFEMVAQNFIPPMMDPVLGDYQRGCPGARDSQVLALFATVVKRLKGAILNDVPRIFEAVFECTLQMITVDNTSFPEHRIHFFQMLQQITTHALPALFALSEQKFQLVIDSIVWAMKDSQRDVADTGLTTLLTLLTQIQKLGAESSEIPGIFFQRYILKLIQEVFFVLTDRVHSSGLKLQAQILEKIYHMIQAGEIQVPITPNQQMNNPAFLHGWTLDILVSSFNNVSPQTLRGFVTGLFDVAKTDDLFRAHIKDFLVNLQEFSNDGSAAFEDEAAKEREMQQLNAIPGMVAPHEKADWAADQDVQDHDVEV